LNAAFLWGNPRFTAHTMFDSLPIDAMSVLQPDPVFKKSQWKRRALHPDLIDALAPFVRPGAPVEVVSDDWPTMEAAVFELARNPYFDVGGGPLKVDEPDVDDPGVQLMRERLRVLSDRRGPRERTGRQPSSTSPTGILSTNDVARGGWELARSRAKGIHSPGGYHGADDEAGEAPPEVPEAGQGLAAALGLRHAVHALPFGGARSHRECMCLAHGSRVWRAIAVRNAIGTSLTPSVLDPRQLDTLTLKS